MPRYKFMEIAENITEKRMPLPEDKDLYIAPNNLDTDTLSVPEYGYNVDLNGTKLIMHKGDMLFGRREPQLKKAAIAPHDGLFSAHGMIFHPKENIISKDFFPFFISSDYFFDAAIRIAVGSLSPTVNWKDLKDLEFDIPELSEQKQYADILWSMIKLKKSYKKLITATDALIKSQFIEMFGDPVSNSKGLKLRTLPELGENLDNRRVPITSGDRKAGLYPYYGASGIVDYVDDFIFDEDILLISEDGANLLARTTPIAFPSTGKVWVNNHAHVMRFEKMAMQVYVENLLNSIDISGYVTGTAQPKLNQAKLNSIPIPVPDDDALETYMAFKEQSDKSKFELKKSVDSITEMMNALKKQIFNY